MKRSWKFKIYPNREQTERLDLTLRLSRNLYNAGLEQRITAYKLGYSVSYTDQARELPHLKRELPEYTDVFSQVLQDTLRRIDKAYTSFYRRVKENKGKAGFPRFKGYARFKSITYPQMGFEVLKNGHLTLSKIGTIRMFRHREILGTIKTCTIKQDAVGDWYAVFTSELPDIPQRQLKTAIGIDVGLKNLVVLSNGEVKSPPGFLKKSEDNIKRKQREVSRKKKGSNNRRKCVKRLARSHRRVQRQRDDFMHKVSRYLSTKADAIVFENINIKNMQKNHRLAKSIGDASWGKLMQYTAYKAAEAGGQVYYVNPNGTSQVCSRCGTIVRKTLSQRRHICSVCGYSADRDLNASFNIMKRLPTDSGELYKTPAETAPPQLLSEELRVRSMNQDASHPMHGCKGPQSCGL